MGKLRGIWSRPTPKGDVEGDLTRGCGDPPVTATAAGYWNAFLFYLCGCNYAIPIFLH